MLKIIKQEIDIPFLVFKESHEIDGVYNWDEGPDVKITTTTVGNESVKQIVKSFDKKI